MFEVFSVTLLNYALYAVMENNMIGISWIMYTVDSLYIMVQYNTILQTAQ